MDEHAPGEGEGRARRVVRRALPVLAVLALGLTIAGVSWWLWAEEPTGTDVASAPPPKSLPPAPPVPAPLEELPLEELPPAVREYLARNEYPPTSGPLGERHEDLLYPNRRFERLRPIADTLSGDPGELVRVRLTADRWEYTGDAVALLLLEASRGSAVHRIRILEASAQREGRAGALGDPVPVRFAPEGGRYEAELSLSRFADHHGPIVVSVRLEYADSAVHEESLRLFLTPASRIPARFTGEVADRVYEGALRIDVGIDVEQPGFYRIDANLYALGGAPVAFATFKGDLERSTRSVPLEFFGKVLADAAVPGPYRVGEIRGYRFLDGAYPDRERIPDLAGRFTTAAHPLDSLSDAVWDHPDKQRMVELMMEDVRNGLALETPPLPGAPPAEAPAAPQSSAESF